MESRSRRSKQVGIAMLGSSGAFFALAFVTRYLLFEVSAVAAFVFGVVLLVSEPEQRVRLTPVAGSLDGPVRAVIAFLDSRGWKGNAKFVPNEKSAKVLFDSTAGDGVPIVIEPPGAGLAELYTDNAGEFVGRGVEFVGTWIPRTLVDLLGLAESARITHRDGEVSTQIVKPFVRPLCVKPFFTANVCSRMGCPLVSSIGETLAVATGDVISHVNCSYDPVSQTAKAVHRISRE